MLNSVKRAAPDRRIEHAVPAERLGDGRGIRAVVDNDVGAFLSVEKFEPVFRHHQRRRVMQILRKIMHKILPHPFFGGEYEVFFPDNVKYVCASPVVADADVVPGQIECFHRVNFAESYALFFFWTKKFL